MIKTIRNVSIVVFLAFLALNLDFFFRIAWFETFLAGRTFSVPFGWVQTPFIIKWIPSLIVFALFGYIVGRLIQSRVRAFWPIAFGVLCTAVWILTSRIGFAEGAGVIDYVWGYSRYLMPPLGSLLGGLVAMKVSSRLTTRCNGRG